ITQYTRPALLALLLCSDPGFTIKNAGSAAQLATALGRVQHYDVLSPLERLAEHPAPEVRAAVMGAAVLVYAARSIGLVRKGLGDTAPLVVDHALRALRGVTFVDALDPVLRIFRDTADEQVRVAALEGIGELKTPAAAVVLIEAVRQETGAVRAMA